MCPSTYMYPDTSYSYGIHVSGRHVSWCKRSIMGCRLFICVHYRMSLTPLREWWRCRSSNISPQLSAISSTGCLWNAWSSSRRYSCTRSSVRQLHRTLSTCQPVSTSYTRRSTSSLGRSRGSCAAAMQNNKIGNAKFSSVCSANLELTNDDRSRRFYFNKQCHWTFESWIVSQT